MIKTNEEIVDKNINQISAYIFGRSISLHDSAKYERQAWIDTLKAKDRECDERVREEMRTTRQGITDYVNQKFSEGVIVDPVELYEALTPKIDKTTDI